jgi:hypothetical protein
MNLGTYVLPILFTLISANITVVKYELAVWYEERGFHWLTKSGKRIPVFFLSMLSGQRSLDRWSYERLIWHIKQAVKINHDRVLETHHPKGVE